MLQRGDSLGVFQVESRAQMAMLPRLKPRHFYDLVIQVAIVRPGPIQGDMVHPYLRRRQGLEPVDYPSEGIRRVLERTLGVPIFQEQVIELAVVAAGFTPGEADQLRRAMAAWKRRGGLGAFEQKLIDGMLARGHDRDFAERVFRQIQGFGEYGFPESHAASFALLVYVSAWLKRHEPAAFYSGLLNSLPMGFYSPSQIIQDAARHGIEVRPVDVQRSDWDHRLEGPPPAHSPSPAPGVYRANDQPPLRLGLRLVKGLSETAAQRIAAARPFRDVDDLARRAGLNDQALRFLARAGALKSLAGHRYRAHWEVAGIAEPTALEMTAPTGEAQVPGALPTPSAVSDMLDDYRYLGLTLGEHPLALVRRHPHLGAALRRCRTAAGLADCRHGQLVRVAGLVTGRQRPGTASGVLFVTLEDDTGNINLVVWPSVLERFRPAVLQGQLLRVKGTVERDREVIHVVAGQVEDASGWLGMLSETAGDEARPFRSRDFR
jgi:error-prone DNA polymerase